MPPGVTVFDAASWNGIAIDSTCGGHGTCKKCKVQVARRHACRSRAWTSRAFSRRPARATAGGWPASPRPPSDLAVDVPPLIDPAQGRDGRRRPAGDPAAGHPEAVRRAGRARRWPTSAPTCERLLAAIDDLELRADLHALRRLPTVLRAADFKVTAVVVDEALIDVEPGDTTEQRYAIAFDLGTTTVVATLLDMATGTPVAVHSMLNKQQPFGADVITRISATMMDPAALDRLRALAHETLDELAREVCAEGGVDPAEVYEIALAGNATMTALALGIDPEPLGVAPFIMSTRDAARDAGRRPRARPSTRAPGRWCSPRSAPTSAATSSPGCSPPGMDRDKRAAAVHRRRHQLRDRARATATGSSPRRRPPVRRSRAAPIRCGMRAADGAIEVVKLGAGDEPSSCR